MTNSRAQWFTHLLERYPCRSAVTKFSQAEPAARDGGRRPLAFNPRPAPPHTRSATSLRSRCSARGIVRSVVGLGLQIDFAKPVALIRSRIPAAIHCIVTTCDISHLRVRKRAKSHTPGCGQGDASATRIIANPIVIGLRPVPGTAARSLLCS
jgi:hypothetical protein